MKLITYNMRGKNLDAIQWRLDSEQPDIMVVQESGNLGSSFGVEGATDRAVRVGTHAGYNIWWVDWSRTGAGSTNPRCSLAMCFKDDGEPVVFESDDAEKRPVMGKTISSRWYVVNVHAGGREYIDECLGIARSRGTGKNWVVAGDFNQSPRDVQDRLRPLETVIAPDDPTRPQSGRTIDFAITNAAHATTRTMPNYLGSDHVAVVVEWS